MAVAHLCGYCQALPENDRTHAVRVMRCPLCKTELGFTEADEHFRLREGPAPVPALPWGSPKLWIGAGIGVTMTVLLLTLLTMVFA